MIELKDELFAAPINEWQNVPFTENRHLWRLQWYRTVNESFGFLFRSPKGRRYFFFIMRDNDGERVIDADVSLANGKTIASHWKGWGDKDEKLNAVLSFTPTHVLDRLFLLLEAIG